MFKYLNSECFLEKTSFGKLPFEQNPSFAVEKGYQLSSVDTGLVIRSFAHSSFAHALRLLRSNERLWVICSHRSGQMSKCEQIAQVACVKRATVSSLRSLIRANSISNKHNVECCFNYIFNKLHLAKWHLISKSHLPVRTKYSSSMVTLKLAVQVQYSYMYKLSY